MRRLSAQEVDKQTRRVYFLDRLPSVGGDRNELGKAGRDRLEKEERQHRREEGLCVECGRPILGRPATAATCFLHRLYGGPPTRAELVALIAEHEALLDSLREALAEMDEADAEVNA